MIRTAFQVSAGQYVRVHNFSHLWYITHTLVSGKEIKMFLPFVDPLIFAGVLRTKDVSVHDRVLWEGKHIWIAYKEFL